MNKTYRLAVIGAAILVIAVFVVWDGFGAARTIEERIAQESALIDGKCSNTELVDRTLLQQSWYYDEDFTRLAGGFGQLSFSFYENGDTAQIPSEGAYCIDGRDLRVVYFESRSVPVALDLWPVGLRIEFGTKIRPSGKDVYAIRELTYERMILRFESDGRDHVFYRKN